MLLDEITPEQRLRILGFPDPSGLFQKPTTRRKPRIYLRRSCGTGLGRRRRCLCSTASATWRRAGQGSGLSGYAQKSWRKTAHPRDKPYMQDLTPRDYNAFVGRVRVLLERYQQLVGDMHKAGEKFLAGTDTSLTNPVIPGVGLHQELALLVESGLSPLEALETATKNPAMFLGVLNQLGTIEAGKIADIVMLDADPLKDIHNTEKIRGVIMRGHYFSRTDLDGMLQHAAASAGQ